MGRADELNGYEKIKAGNKTVNLNRTNIGGKCQNWKWDILDDFQTPWYPICSLSFLANTHGHICLVITHFTLSLPLKLLERNTLDQCVKQRPEEGKNRDARTYTIGIEKCWLRSTQHSSLLIWGDDIYWKQSLYSWWDIFNDSHFLQNVELWMAISASLDL